jgi:peroxiredoxin
MIIRCTLFVVLFTFVCLPAFGEEKKVPASAQEEARQILQELRHRFQDRPPYQLSFLTEFERLGGTRAGITVNQGEKPVTHYKVEGLVRRSGEKLETYRVSARLINDWRKVTEYHSVWQDGRAFELRKYLETGGEEAVTRRWKLHDMIRPDEKGWFADGVFIESNHYSEDLLGVPELKIARETTMAGDELLRIEGEIPSGTLTVWLNIEKPATLKRASFKASSNLVSQLSDVNAFNLEVEVLEHVRIDEVTFPTKAVATYTYKIPSARENLVKRLTTTRSELQVNPNFGSMNAFQIDFPEGMIVEDYEANVKYKWARGKLRPAHYVSLINKLLPELDGIKSDLIADQAKDKMILACFFDMNQRPSRNCIMQLRKNAEELEQTGVVVAGVQASRIDRDTLDEWIKENNIPFSVGMITDDAEQVRFAWGVRALPWLILTNEKHIVQAEGFSINELDEKITTLKEK